MNGRTDDTRKPAVDNCLVESEVAPEPLWVRCLIGRAGSIGSLAQLNFGGYVVTRSCTSIDRLPSCRAGAWSSLIDLSQQATTQVPLLTAQVAFSTPPANLVPRAIESTKLDGQKGGSYRWRQLALALVLFTLFSSRAAAQNSDNTAFLKLEGFAGSSAVLTGFVLIKTGPGSSGQTDLDSVTGLEGAIIGNVNKVL